MKQLFHPVDIHCLAVEQHRSPGGCGCVIDRTYAYDPSDAEELKKDIVEAEEGQHAHERRRCRRGIDDSSERSTAFGPPLGQVQL